MLRKLACVLALVPGFWLTTAQALGLGEINVRSKLNQPFAATIPVTSAAASESATLVVRLADADAFTRAGIERADDLSSLQFALAPDGSKIQVSSAQPVREPFLNFIVDARWDGGHVLREYTVLLDPPGPAAAAPAPAVSPAVAAAPAVTEAAAAPPPAAPAAKKSQPALKPRLEKPSAVKPVAPPTAPAGGDVYGPVQLGETLWSIATKTRPAGVTMDQMLLALYQGNPQAFDGGLNGLLKNTRLKVPSRAEATSVDAATAKARVDELRSKTGAAAETTAPVSGLPGLDAAPAPKPVQTPMPAMPVHPPVSKSGSAPESPPESAPQTSAPAPSAPAAVVPGAPESLAPAAANPAPAGAAVQAAPESTTPAPAASENAADTSAATATTPADAAAAPADASAIPAAPPAEVENPVPTPAAALPTVPAPAPASQGNSSSALEDYKLPLLGILLLLVIAIFVVNRVRRSRADAEFARSSRPLMGTPEAMDFNDPSDTDPAGLPRRSAPTMDAGTASASASEAPDGDDAATSPGVTMPKFGNPEGHLPSGAPEFDQTEPGDARTLAMNLDTGDPLTEADFHLAYGLYDEAAQMLVKAAEQDPDRVELRTKLAETYFAAGKPVEFQEVAEGLQDEIGHGEWDKIAAMGRQLCPDSSLFHHSEGSADAEPMSAAGGGDAELLADGRAGATRVNIIDFDLDHELANAAAAEPKASDNNDGALDLTSFDLDSTHASDAKSGAVDFNLEELDLGKFDDSEQAHAPGDEIDTKLDLARAYADMGDNEAARSLLAEVLEGGSDKQKQEAETLQQRLSA